MRRRLALLVLTCVLFVGLLGTSLVTKHSTAQDTAPPTITLCHPFQNFQRDNGIVFFVGHLETFNASQARTIRQHIRTNNDVIVTPDWEEFLVPGMPCCAFSVLPDGTIVPGRVD
jgi:hypothetical protein